MCNVLGDKKERLRRGLSVCQSVRRARHQRSEMVKEVEYVCPLSEETRELAARELREDKDTRENAITQMKKWAQDNPKIEFCRTDPCFLLRFLRVKKFSLPMAQEAMERYLLLRQTYSYAFQNMDCLLPTMDTLFSLGYIFAAPGRDKQGRRWIIARPGVFDPHKFTNADMCRVHGIAYETLMEDEESQVRGFVHFGDGAGVTFPHLTLFTPKEAVRIVKNGERTLPMRHKEVYGINVHPSVKYALDWGMSLISEKIKKRVKIFTNLEDVKKNMDTSMLPKEYGGTIPMAEMIDLWKKELLASRDRLLSHDKMKVRLELFSEGARAGAVSALRNNSCGPQSDILAGSFRKLQVD